MTGQRIRWQFREQKWGDNYTIDCEWDPSVAAYRLYCMAHPPSPRYTLGHPAHLLDRDEICVKAMCRPTSVERAKAIAIHWVAGFSVYIRTGRFENGQVKVHINDD